MTFRVLSIDGGGIRGIIPAIVLAELEKRTGRPISESFDLLAGTSTGGILALGLATPGSDGTPEYSAQDLVRLYRSEGRRIFSRSVLHRARAFGRLAKPKYPTDGLEAVLRDYFGEVMLSEALTDVVIPSYDIEKRLPIYFTSFFAKYRPGFDHEMRRVARSTASAPTYFQPFELETSSSAGRLAVIDGGVFANNPTLAGFAEATGTFEARIDNLTIISLGTGQGAQSVSLSKVRGWGLIRWSTKILDVVLDSVSESVHHEMYYLLRGTPSQRRYRRLQLELRGAERRLDNASEANIDKLVRRAEAFLEAERDQLDQICRLIA